MRSRSMANLLGKLLRVNSRYSAMRAIAKPPKASTKHGCNDYTAAAGGTLALGKRGVDVVGREADRAPGRDALGGGDAAVRQHRRVVGDQARAADARGDQGLRRVVVAVDEQVAAEGGLAVLRLQLRLLDVARAA